MSKKIQSNKSASSKSLLRYPGGKTRAVEMITKMFPEGITEMCSPFFGGGSIEIFMASQGVRVYGYDIFTPLVEFWQTVSKNPKELAKEVKKLHPMSKGKFYKIQKNQNTLKSKMKRAAAFYAINRSSFSGSTMSGGMSPNHPRFNIESIDRLREFHNSNFSVNKLSFESALEEHKNIFKYLDPPYLIKQSLYGKNGNTHKDFNHTKLCEIIKTQSNWIMSYNDCPEIREMYSEFKTIVPTWKYGMSKNKSSNEVIIFSKDLGQ
jgi:DNA adenine methylase